MEKETSPHVFCAAIYAIDRGMEFGLGAHSTSGTVTFLRYRGLILGLTCAHVVDVTLMKCRREFPDKRFALATSGVPVPWVMRRPNSDAASDRAASDFRNALNDDFTDAFAKVPIALHEAHAPDIAIAHFNGKDPAQFFRDMKKRVIIPNFESRPSFNEIERVECGGFPNDAKVDLDNGTFSASSMRFWSPMLSRSQGAEFTFGGELPPGDPIHDLSGISGGPAFWVKGEEAGFLGIVIEANPDQASGLVLVRGLDVRPELLDDWLQRIGIDVSALPPD